MSGLLRDSTVAWQSLLPERFGEATVSVRLEEQSGDLIIGRQINVRVRTKFLERLLSFSAVSTAVLGILGISAAVFIKISDILGNIEHNHISRPMGRFEKGNSALSMRKADDGTPNPDAELREELQGMEVGVEDA